MLGVLVTGVVALVGYIFVMAPVPAPSPRTQMVSYAVQQITDNPLQDIGDLPIADMKAASGSACVAAHGVEATRIALKAQLESTIPPHISAIIVQAAVLPRTSVENAYQNMSFAMEQAQTAYHYMCYYNTVFREPDVYESCVLAVKVELRAGEVLIGMQDEQYTETTHTEPCECSTIFGIRWCYQCPVTAVRKVQRPIYKRTALTLDQQRAFNRYMMHLAAEQVKDLNSRPYTNKRLLQQWAANETQLAYV